MLDFEFEPTDSTKKLISAISEKLNVPEDQLRLICQQSIMKAEKTIEDNKVSETTVIQITVKKTSEQPAAQPVSPQLAQPQIQAAPQQPKAPQQVENIVQTSMTKIKGDSILVKLLELEPKKLSDPDFISEVLDCTTQDQKQKMVDKYFPPVPKVEIPKDELTDPLPKSYVQTILKKPEAKVYQGQQAQQPQKQQQAQPKQVANQQMPILTDELYEVLSSPMMQQVLQNPVQFAQIIQNPQIQQFFQQNPQLAAMTSNPELLRKTLLQELEKVNGPMQAYQQPQQNQPQQAQQTIDQLRQQYAQELETIKAMGIAGIPDDEILQMLSICNGNIEQVIANLFDQ